MRKSIIPAILRLPFLALFGLTGAAQAQNDASPLIPNLNGFSLPASRPTSEPPVPTASTPTPQPTAISTRRAPEPGATPTQRSVPAPVVRPTATPEPRPSTAPPAATPIPTTPSPVEISPAPAATPTVALPAPVEAEQSAGSNGTWIWLGVGILALAGLLFAVFRFRSRSGRELLEPVHTIDIGPDDIDPVPVPPAEAHAPVPPPPPAASQGRARIDITMRPVRAGTNLTSGAVDYEIGLRNSGDVPATDVRVDIRLMNASADQAAMLKLLFAQSIEKPLVARFDLSPGQAVTLGGMAMIPQEGIAPVSIGGRNFFVPMFSVNVLYGWAGGGQGQTAAAWVVGIERAPGEKMVPFRLGTGPRMYDAVGQRPQGFAITR